MPRRKLPVPDFGTLSFTHVDFVGIPPGPSHGSLIRVFRQHGGTLEIATSHFSPTERLPDDLQALMSACREAPPYARRGRPGG